MCNFSEASAKPLAAITKIKSTLYIYISNSNLNYIDLACEDYNYKLSSQELTLYTATNNFRKLSNNRLLNLINYLLKKTNISVSNSYLAVIIGIIPTIYIRKVLKFRNFKFKDTLYKSNLSRYGLKSKRARRLRKKRVKRLLTTNYYSQHIIILGSILKIFLNTKFAFLILNLRKALAKSTQKKLVLKLVRENIKFHYRLGTGFFLKEAVQVTLLALSLKDPLFFLN